MSEDTTGTSTNPADQPQTPPVASPAPPAAPDLGTPPAAPTVPPPSSQIDTENLARRFDTERGKWQQYMSEVASWQGGMQQQLNTARGLLNDRVARVQELERQLAALQEQVNAVPGLKEQASQAAQYQEQLDRLKQITAYPEVVNRVQEQQVAKEDGTTEVIRVNPILDMLMNTNLQGDAFHQNLVGVVATLTQSQVPPAAPSSQAPPTAGMTPAPMASSADEAFWQQYNEAQAKGDYNRMGELLQERAVQMDQRS